MGLLDLTPVKQRTLSDEAAHRLRTAIRNGVLRPGTRLVERDLAERLGMSRIPVREAIQRLVEEGLVQKSPHRGTFVYAPTKQGIEEISSMRVVLESFVAERAIAHWTDEVEVQLREIVEMMRTAAKRGDWQQIHECDYHFHGTLWALANHTVLLEVVSSLRSRINRFLFEVSGALPASDMDQHIASHDHLIDTFKSGDVAKAQQEMTDHVHSATRRIMTYCNFVDDTSSDNTSSTNAGISLNQATDNHIDTLGEQQAGITPKPMAENITDITPSVISPAP